MKNLLVLFVLGLAFASAPALAAIDLSSVTSAFTDLNTSLTTVGGLLLSAAVVAVAFKWVKAMIFG